MNKEDYVNLEVAKMLKEKGFPQEYNVGTICRLQNKANPYYENTRIIVQSDIDNAWCIFNEVYPSLYEAQKWLRKQGVFIVITPRYTDKYQIIEYEYRIIQYTDLIDKNRNGKLCYVVYESFEECLNEGILESLKFI